ncbi:MAG: hypothetical protein IJP66_01965 [Kiritimatiellae bacterium]|nr:hypothetical protein [Kiritimatiellia bacterium]
MATMQDISFDELFAEPQKDQREDSLDSLFGDVGNGATKMAAGIRPMADAAQQEAYRRADALAAAARSGGIRPRDDSMGAARRYAEHIARGQRAADAFGRTHVGSAALQAKIDADRRAQDLDWAKEVSQAGIRRREIDTGLASESEKTAGALAQENARGMWGVTDAAAKVASDAMTTRGGIRQAAINAKSQAAADAAAAKRQQEHEEWGAEQARLQRDFYERQRLEAQRWAEEQEAEKARQAAAAQDAGGMSQGAPSDVVRIDDNGNYYKGDYTPTSYAPEKARAYNAQEIDTMKKNGRLEVAHEDKIVDAFKKDENGRDSADIYWWSNYNPITGRDMGNWIVMLKKDYERQGERARKSFIRGDHVDADVYYGIRRYYEALANAKK